MGEKKIDSELELGLSFIHDFFYITKNEKERNLNTSFRRIICHLPPLFVTMELILECMSRAYMKDHHSFRFVKYMRNLLYSNMLKNELK